MPCHHYHGGMGRWEPNAQRRLASAALELFAERGYDQTTVADIAGRAGLTARTFFRYFADKREVLFAGSADLEAHLVDALERAPQSATPLQAVATGIEAVADLLTDQDFSGRRQRVVAATAELRERELIKLASLSAALADGLRRRGVSDPAAGLAAEAGVAVFRVAFERWVAGADGSDLRAVVRDSFAELRTLAG